MARVIYKEKCSESINCKRRHLEKDKQNTVSLKQNSKEVWGSVTDYQIYQLKYLYVFLKAVLENSSPFFF